jgi:hypothetical protein
MLPPEQIQDSGAATVNCEGDCDRDAHAGGDQQRDRTGAGIGAMLAQQFDGVGGRVVDVPPELSARMRLLERSGDRQD